MIARSKTINELDLIDYFLFSQYTLFPYMERTVLDSTSYNVLKHSCRYHHFCCLQKWVYLQTFLQKERFYHMGTEIQL